MNILPSILILLVTLLTVFAQAALPGFRPWFGAQVDLLPALMIYTALTSNMVMVVGIALVGGLALDSLSANPLGVSLLPLFAVGLIIHSRRDLILRDQVFAQFVLGGLASAVVPAATLLLLLSAGEKPLLGWGAILDRGEAALALGKYLHAYPQDDVFLRCADVIVTSLVPWQRIDLGHEDLAWATDSDRMYHWEHHYTEREEVARRCAGL